jgi:hypothetical protein
MRKPQGEEHMVTRSGSTLVTAIAIAGLLVGCGGGGDDTAAAGGDMGDDEGAAGAAMTTVDPAEAATISGMVMFEGTPPATSPIDMSEEPDCAAKYTGKGPMTQEVVVADGHLANVFVYVKEGLDGTFAPPATAVTLDQNGCRYHPHVLGIQTDQDLDIVNSDGLLHNINTQSTANRSFNVSQPRSMETTRSFKSEEVMIPVKCDVHGWMHAYIGVLDHPYYAVTGPDGSFTIANLPPGDYVIEAWHEEYGTQTQQVTVAAQETGQASFTYSDDMAGADVPLGEPLILSHATAGH